VILQCLLKPVPLFLLFFEAGIDQHGIDYDEKAFLMLETETLSAKMLLIQANIAFRDGNSFI
jgi:hypothetical protein